MNFVFKISLTKSVFVYNYFYCIYSLKYKMRIKTENNYKKLFLKFKNKNLKLIKNKNLKLIFYLFLQSN